MAPEEPFYVHPDDPPSKRAILVAALDLFTRKGLAATTLRDIAQVSGFTNPALYRFFDSKDDLALFLFRRCYERQSRTVSAVLADDAPFADNLRRVVTGSVEFFQRHPEAFLYVQDNLRHFWPLVPEAEQQRSLVTVMRRVVGQGVAEGVVADDVPLDVLVAAVGGLLAQVARMRYLGELAGHDDLAAEVHRVARRALAHPDLPTARS